MSAIDQLALPHNFELRIEEFCGARHLLPPVIRIYEEKKINKKMCRTCICIFFSSYILSFIRVVLSYTCLHICPD